jgi:hypothetical protein
MENDHIQYSWQQTVLDAFLSSAADLPGKISIAVQTIMRRLKAPENISPAEHVALEDALRSLRVLVADLKSQANAQSDCEGDEEDRNRFG